MYSRVKSWRLAISAAVLTIPALAACSESPPTAEIRGARDAIARAQYDGAGQLAPEPLQMAQHKLATAQAKVSSEDMGVAKNLAEESEADADYADAIAVVAKSTQTNQQLQMLHQQKTAPQN
jgi:hypothetical protein